MTPSRRRDLFEPVPLRVRLLLVFAAMGAVILVAWLAGPFGVPGFLLGIERLLRWLSGDLDRASP